ncbi:MAG: hypothetical protein MJZ34_05480 [Paludibacteraceae bacterium]|nr:hypothetical protein [Paludibacteraceae bacterium]
MNTFLFIFSVMWICLGLFALKSPNPTLEKWQSNLLAILLVVGGCIGAGVALI